MDLDLVDYYYAKIVAAGPKGIGVEDLAMGRTADMSKMRDMMNKKIKAKEVFAVRLVGNNFTSYFAKKEWADSAVALYKQMAERREKERRLNKLNGKKMDNSIVRREHDGPKKVVSPGGVVIDYSKAKFFVCPPTKAGRIFETDGEQGEFVKEWIRVRTAPQSRKV